MVGFHVMLKIYVSFKQNFIRYVTPDNLAKTVCPFFSFILGLRFHFTAQPIRISVNGNRTYL